jgi:hypothetical protein
MSNYFANHPELIKYASGAMETMQDKYPRYVIGWDGFTMFVYFC